MTLNFTSNDVGRVMCQIKYEGDGKRKMPFTNMQSEKVSLFFISWVVDLILTFVSMEQHKWTTWDHCCVCVWCPEKTYPLHPWSWLTAGITPSPSRQRSRSGKHTRRNIQMCYELLHTESANSYECRGKLGSWTDVKCVQQCLPQ